MADPRLNSLHLDNNRRVEYRRAREVLLNAHGSHTLHAFDEGAASGSARTIIPKNNGSASRPLTCWLSDGEFLYPLQIGLNTLGRANDNNVVVEDAYVSRRQCAILIHSTEIAELHDTASKNGTYLNGQRLTVPVVLRNGDEIRMSEHKYTFFNREGNVPVESLDGTIVH